MSFFLEGAMDNVEQVYFYSTINIPQKCDQEYIKINRRFVRYIYGLIDCRYNAIRLFTKN